MRILRELIQLDTKKHKRIQNIKNKIKKTRFHLGFKQTGDGHVMNPVAEFGVSVICANRLSSSFTVRPFLRMPSSMVFLFECGV